MKTIYLFLISLCGTISFAQNKTNANKAKVLGITFDSINYTTVQHVVIGSAAHKAGFYRNDKIIKINNLPVKQTNITDFLKYLNTLPDKINFEIEHKNKSVKLIATKTAMETFLNKCVSGNCQNGKGTFTYSNYSSFIGEFKDGKKVNGMQLYRSGNYYVGNFENEQYNGYGEFYFLMRKKDTDNMEYDSWDELYYKGQYKNGKYHGQGEYKSPQYTYKGDFVNNIRQGQGFLRWSNYETYNGEFYEDKLNGKGIYAKVNYWKYDGEFKDNLKNGYGKYYELDDGRIEKIFEESWDNGNLISRTEIDKNTKLPIATTKVKSYEYTPNTNKVHLGITTLWVGSVSSGPTTYYVYNIYGNKGQKISVKDENKLKQKVETLYYSSNEFVNEKYKKQVLKITFNKDINEDEAARIIKDSGKEFNMPISDIDIYKKGKFVLTEN